MLFSVAILSNLSISSVGKDTPLVSTNGVWETNNFPDSSADTVSTVDADNAGDMALKEWWWRERATCRFIWRMFHTWSSGDFSEDLSLQRRARHPYELNRICLSLLRAESFDEEIDRFLLRQREKFQTRCLLHFHVAAILSC